MAVDTANTLQKSLAGEKWNRFLRAHPLKQELKSAEHAKTYEEFLSLVETITGEKNFLLPIWQDIQFAHHLGEEHQGTHEAESHEQSHNDQAKEVLKEDHISTVVDLFKRPKFMEEDPRFWEMQHKIQEHWDELHPAPKKDASEEDRLAYEQGYTDFVFGSLDEENQSPSLEDQAKEDSRKKHLSQTDDAGKQKNERQRKNDRERIEKYDAYDKLLTRKTIMQTDRALRFDEDHTVHAVNRAISGEAAARKELLKKKGLKGTELDQSYQAVLKRIQEKQWKKFAIEHPEKAAHFASQNYDDPKSWTNDAFAAFKLHHEAVLKEKEPQQAAATEPSAPESTQPPESPPPPSTPPEIKPVQPSLLLTPEQKLEAELAQMKIAAAQRAQQKTPQPTGRLQGNNPAAFAPPVVSTPPPPVTPRKPPAGPVASQGAVRPGGRVSYPSTIPFGARGQGQVRPSFGFRFPRSFLRRPGAASPRPSGMPFRRGGGAIDALNNGLSSGVDALQTGMNMLKTAENVVSALRFLSGFMGPWFPFLIAGLLILAFVLSFFAAFSSTPNFNATVSPISPTPAPTSSTTISGLTLILTGPDAVPNSENIRYEITATYTGTASVTLADALPADTAFIGATGKFKTEGTTTTWALDENDGGTASPKLYTFTITLHPTKDDMLVKNKITATAIGGSGAEPNSDTCGGKYTFTSPFNNFGDPSCNFDKDTVYTTLKQLDPANADRWFFKIIACESNYNPNAYLAASTSGLGAFGLFQMNPKGKGNGVYDAGNVDWTIQIPNAVSYNKLIGGSFAYWACR